MRKYLSETPFVESVWEVENKQRNKKIDAKVIFHFPYEDKSRDAFWINNKPFLRRAWGWGWGFFIPFVLETDFARCKDKIGSFIQLDLKEVIVLTFIFLYCLVENCKKPHHRKMVVLIAAERFNQAENGRLVTRFSSSHIFATNVNHSVKSRNIHELIPNEKSKGY